MSVADVQLDVVAGGFDPVDLVGPHEEHAPAGLDHETFEALRVRLEVLHELEQPALEIAVGRTLQMLAGADERFVEALAIERLEQVVEGVDVEGA